MVEVVLFSTIDCDDWCCYECVAEVTKRESRSDDSIVLVAALFVVVASLLHCQLTRLGEIERAIQRNLWPHDSVVVCESTNLEQYVSVLLMMMMMMHIAGMHVDEM